MQHPIRYPIPSEAQCRLNLALVCLAHIAIALPIILANSKIQDVAFANLSSRGKYNAGLLLADPRHQQLTESLDFSHFAELVASEKNCSESKIDGRWHCVAQAKPRRFETYATGWHSFIPPRLP